MQTQRTRQHQAGTKQNTVTPWPIRVSTWECSRPTIRTLLLSWAHIAVLLLRFVNRYHFFPSLQLISFQAFTGFDLMSQAIAQVWSDGFSLPAQTEIDRWCDEQYKYMLSQVTIWRIHKPGLPPALLEKWLNVATGNGLEQMLGWSWRAWSFWWNDRALYKVIMDGIDTPFVYRLFDGRRPKWDGARDAILRTNGRSA